MHRNSIHKEITEPQMAERSRFRLPGVNGYVRTDLLRRQADSVGLPFRPICLPPHCGNEVQEERLRAVIGVAQSDGKEGVALGDLFPADAHQYRERTIARTGITPVFPLWGQPTAEQRLYTMSE
jgi:diphthamide synthase (EF-2-diphthine--ammonia ligase)